MGVSAWYRRNIVGRWQALFAAVAIAALANVGALALYVTRPVPYAPLGPYPVQQVQLPTSVVDDDATPATEAVLLPTLTIRAGQRHVIVPVVAQKCTKEATTVESHYRWRNVQPPGFTSPDLVSQTDLAAGCTTIQYANQMPSEVYDRVEALHDAGQDVSVWQIQGNDRPVPDGTPIYWPSGNFAVVWVS